MNQIPNSSDFELQLSFIRTNSKDKMVRLMQILDYIDFNHVVIFVRSPEHCMEMENFLIKEDFPAIGIHNELSQEESLERNRILKESKMLQRKRSSSGLNVFDNLNIILNYDVPDDSQAFLRQLTGAFKLGSKCLSIAFITNDTEIKVLREVQCLLKIQLEKNFSVDVKLKMEAAFLEESFFHNLSIRSAKECPAPPSTISPFALLAFLLISVNTVMNIINSINNNNNNNNNNMNNNNNNNNIQAMTMNQRRSLHHNKVIFGVTEDTMSNVLQNILAQSSFQPSDPEQEVESILKSGSSIWDLRLFDILRRPESHSKQRRPGLEVLHLWLKSVFKTYPKCWSETACFTSSYLIGDGFCEKGQRLECPLFET